MSKKIYESIEEKRRAEYLRNKDKYLARAKKWAEKNPEKRLEIVRKYDHKNRESINDKRREKRFISDDVTREGYREYRAKNREKLNANAAKYRSTPKGKAVFKLRRLLKSFKLKSLLTKEDKELVKKLYEEAVIKQEMTGIKQNVDHVIPELGDFVCGFSVPSNLRIISEKDNKEKSNRFVPYSFYGLPFDDDQAIKKYLTSENYLKLKKYLIDFYENEKLLDTSPHL